MIVKLNIQTVLTSLSFSILFLILVLIGAVIGFGGGYLLLSSLILFFERGFNNAMFPWLGISYGICALLFGVIFCIKLFRRMLLQNAEGKLLEKPIFANFVQFIPTRLAVGFVAGLTIHALVVIVFAGTAIGLLK